MSGRGPCIKSAWDTAHSSCQPDQAKTGPQTVGVHPGKATCMVVVVVQYSIFEKKKRKILISASGEDTGQPAQAAQR